MHSIEFGKFNITSNNTLISCPLVIMHREGELTKHYRNPNEGGIYQITDQYSSQILRS